MPNFTTLPRRGRRSHTLFWSTRLYRPTRYLGLVGLVLCTLMSGFTFANTACDAPADDLVSKFLAAVGLRPQDLNGPIRLARWDKKDLVIGVFQDRSARAPTDVSRNLSIFHAVGKLGSIFHFGVNFSTPNSDIELVFLSQTMKQAVLQSLPAGAVAAGQNEGCPVYLEFTDDAQGIRRISKAHILVVSNMEVEAMPSCVELALIHAVGFVGWHFSDGPQPYAYTQLHIFVSALYDSNGVVDVADIRKEITAARSQLCAN